MQLTHLKKKKKGGWGLGDHSWGGLMATRARLSKGPLPQEAKLRKTHRAPICPLFPAPARQEDAGEQHAAAEVDMLGSLRAWRTLTGLAATCGPSSCLPTRAGSHSTHRPLLLHSALFFLTAVAKSQVRVKRPRPPCDIQSLIQSSV